MEDKNGDVIYVGKSRALRDRVSQYFHGSHDLKTAKMASRVNNFRFFICDSEMDALVLENDLIKKYKPKYNILLKDAKSYPYIKITAEEYPRIVMTRRRDEKGRYFGPYTGAGVINGVTTALERSLGIPFCKKKFPRDIGRGRPCVNSQIGRCMGLCTGNVSKEEYLSRIECAVKILEGSTKDASELLRKRMYEASDNERYEEAARCRDSINALSKLTSKKRTTSLRPDSEYDVFGVTRHENRLCAAVFYIRNGIISDSEQFIFGADEITGFSTRNETDFTLLSEPGGDRTEKGDEVPELFSGEETGDCPFSPFILNLYSAREYIPAEILLSFEMPEKERELIGEYLGKRAGHRVTLRTPVRGEARHVCEMACRDAAAHAESRKSRADVNEALLVSLAKTLSLEVLPDRIECYDISNLGSEFITAGMTVVEGGAFKKSDYRYFRIKSTATPDDYASMREALERRISELSGDDKSFSKMPDLILLDGGAGHVGVVKELFGEKGIEIPVFGMVKDSHHKTRTLVSESEEISIARDPAVFGFIYKLQEEVHRFTIGRMKAAKRKTLKVSEFEKIPGIGPAKAKIILSLGMTMDELAGCGTEYFEALQGISPKDALNLTEYLKEYRKQSRTNNKEVKK